ncbi:MAG: hypothetical protein RhofKO_37170 [Rhodothermales bacterium]
MNTLRSLIIVAGPALILVSCSVFGDDGYRSCESIYNQHFSNDTSLVVGTWDLAYAESAWSTKGCRKAEASKHAWVFSADGTMKRYQDGELVQESRYYFGAPSLDQKRLSIYIDQRPIWSGISADTLILDDSPLDGSLQIYVRR